MGHGGTNDGRIALDMRAKMNATQGLQLHGIACCFHGQTCGGSSSKGSSSQAFFFIRRVDLSMNQCLAGYSLLHQDHELLQLLLNGFCRSRLCG